jgi:stage II sporulation protein D
MLFFLVLSQFGLKSVLAGGVSPQVALYLPQFESQAASVQNSRVSGPFRVLIYPHWGAYSIPQGREPASALHQVRVTSERPCQEYEAKMDAAGQWYPSGEARQSSNQIQLTALKKFALAEARYFKCAAPFKVHRPAPLVSIEYAGDFVSFVQNGRVMLVNLVDPDTYLKGVIPNEVPTTWPKEVLKAQAVAARTYAWFSVLLARQKTARFDLEDTVSDQAYMGILKRTEATDQASDETLGQVLVYDRAPIKAYFSADSGGHTESALAAFGTDLPYCPAQPEQFDVDAMTRPTGWTRSFSYLQLQRLLQAGRGSTPSLFPKGVNLTKLVISKINSSGRVDHLIATGSNGKTYRLTGFDFRYITKVRSTLFSLKNTSNGVQIEGAGFGHGVGLSQWGAFEHHQQLGWGYERILAFYYPQTQIEVR